MTFLGLLFWSRGSRVQVPELGGGARGAGLLRGGVPGSLKGAHPAGPTQSSALSAPAQLPAPDPAPPCPSAPNATRRCTSVSSPPRTSAYPGRPAAHRATHAEARPRGDLAGLFRRWGRRGTLGNRPRSRHLSPARSRLGVRVGVPGWGDSVSRTLGPPISVSLRLSLGLCVSPSQGPLSPASSWARPGRGPREAGRNAGLRLSLPALSKNRRGNRRLGRDPRRAQVPGSASVPCARGHTHGRSRKKRETPEPGPLRGHPESPTP